MSELTKWILNELAPSDSKIKTIVAIYPGRFQPMGGHHAKTYKWLANKFGEKNTFVVTSDKVALPKSPFNFSEKKKVINSHGIKNVIKVKNPYKAEELLSKYDPETTAAVFMVGEKDAGRLSGKFFKKWKGKADIGYKDGAYLVIAPHVSMNVPGFGEMSGTEIRKALGSDRPDKKKIFKGIFGHTNSSIYNLVVPKLEKLKETVQRFIDGSVLLNENSITPASTGTDVDDGPRFFYGSRKAYETLSKEMATKLGLEVVDYMLGSAETMDFKNPYPKGPVDSVTFFPAGVPGETTPTNQGDYKGNAAYNKWKKHVSRFAQSLGYQFVDFLDADDSVGTSKTEPNKVDKNPNISEQFMKNPMEDPKWKNAEDEEDEEVEPLKSKKVDGFVAVTARESVSKEYWDKVFEDISLPVSVGDTVYMGKWKNKKVVVKTIEWNEKGDLLINGKSAMKMRIPNKSNVFGDDPRYSDKTNESIDEGSLPTKITDKYKKLVDKPDSEAGKAFSKQHKASMGGPSMGSTSELDTYDWDDSDDVGQGGYTKEKDKRKKGYEPVTESLILEGGAYGHMAHPFDDVDLKFADIKKMIDLGLQGKLDVEQSVTEKTDGQNLMVTWKDGKLKAARNKTTLKEPMDISAVKSKFAGRGNIEKAFVFAMKDLESAIGKLSDKQRERIFKGGRAFMNLEIIYPKTENVIVYDSAVLQFHGAIEYDENANIVGPVKDSARILQGMIKQVNADVQKSFKIVKPQVLSIKPHNDYTTKRDYFFNKLKKLQKEFNLKDNDTLGLYHQMWWESFVRQQARKMKYNISKSEVEGLTKRWAFFDKSFRLDKKTISDEKFLVWAKDFDKKSHTDEVKKNMLPFETLIFEVGTEILHNVENYLTASPDKAIQKIKSEIHKVAKDIERGGDINKIKKLKQQLEKIERAGGINKIVPSEGLVFIYGGKTYKITGLFGPINQILGTLKFSA